MTLPAWVVVCRKWDRTILAVRKTTIPFLLILSTATITVAAPPSAELRNGRWVTVDAAPPTGPKPPDAQLDEVESLLKAGHLKAARKLDVAWVKSHSKKADWRERAVFLLGDLEYADDDWIKAFYYYDEVMDEYPDSKLFYPALDQQYRIASDYLSGHKDHLLGLPVVSREDEAIEMLYRIQQRSPGSPLAEKALLRTADYYYADGDYDLARDAYTAYAKDYPRSTRLPQIELREAFSSLAQFRGTPYDATPLLEAKAKLQDITAAYPDLAADEDVAALLKAIDQTLSAKLLLTADFYRRTSKPLGAVFMYRYVVAAYPQSPEAATARAALTQMPAFALAQPAPQPTADYQPAGPAVIDANNPDKSK